MSSFFFPYRGLNMYMHEQEQKSNDVYTIIFTN